jgi:hypothetical protein
MPSGGGGPILTQREFLAWDRSTTVEKASLVGEELHPPQASKANTKILIKPHTASAAIRNLLTQALSTSRSLSNCPILHRKSRA